MKSLKVGDWVHIKDRNITIQVTEENLNTTPGYFYFCVGIGGRNYKLSEITMWKPAPGEWCWFWNKKKQNKPKLKQLYSICYDMDVPWKYKTVDCKTYSHCEPFIGNLPSNLKDK